MEIYILRDGAQTGPFSEEQVQAFLKQGSTLINDLAWTAGAPQWLPLHALLYPAAQPTVPPPPPTDQRPPAMPANPILAAAEEEAPKAQPVAAPAKPPKQLDANPPGELATTRQKAFLTYLNLPFSADLTKERAALLVNDAMEDPKNAARIKRWDEDRLRLYPDLFADEVKARKENRPQHYLEVCLGEGADYFEGVTKAHTQVLVGYLDVHHPSWEQNPKSAKSDYFFPALAEKFPQLLKKGARGRFKFPGEGPKVSADLVRSPAAARSRPGRSPVAAAARGLFVGAIVLGLAYAAYQFNTGAWKLPTSTASSGTATDSKASPVAGKPGDQKQPAATPEQPRVAQATPKPVKPEAEPMPKPAADPTLVASLNPPAVPAPADPAPGAEPAKPAMTEPAPAPIPDGSLFAPPPVPPAPVPAPADPTAVPAAAHPTVVRITKATVVPVKFGSLPLRPGTPIQVLSVDGTNIRARVGPDTVSIPIANTDYAPEGAAPPPP